MADMFPVPGQPRVRSPEAMTGGGEAVGRPAISYNPGVIREFSSKMYRMAQTIVYIYTIFAAVVGFVVGLAIVGMIEVSVAVAFLTAFIAGIIGHALGSNKAFWLKLQAQVALCQVEIERNTQSRTGGMH